MSEILHINRHSDFLLLVKFSVNGVPVVVPTYPWRLIFTTDTTHSFNRYVAGFDGEKFTHCSLFSDSSVLVKFEDYNLGPGLLQMTLEAEIPNDLYADGTLDVELPAGTQIELWDKASDPVIPTPEVETAIAYMIKGEGVPAGGTTGQVLKKQSDDDFDAEWQDDESLPSGGSTGQVLAKTSSADGAAGWIDKPGEVVPGSGDNAEAEIFNSALQSDPNNDKIGPGNESHAEGINTFAGGEGSHAENLYTEARGYGSHTEGYKTVVTNTAKFGHAGGNSSTVSGEAGFAHGVNAVSNNRGEAVFGKNNEPDTTGNSIFQVGIGANKNHPQTGFQVDTDGTIWIINTTTGNRISLQSWLNDIQLKKTVVDTLPETGDDNTVYLLRVTSADDEKHNFYEEYIYLNGVWELLGTSDTDESLVERILNNPTFAAVLAGKATQEQFAELQQIATRANERADEAYTRGDQAYALASTANNTANSAVNVNRSQQDAITSLANNLSTESTNRATQDNLIREDVIKRGQEIYDKITDVQTSLTTYVDETRDLILPRSRVKKGADGSLEIRPDGPYHVPEGLGNPWVGIQTYLHGRWRLTQTIGVSDRIMIISEPLCKAIQKAIAGYTMKQANAYGVGVANIADIFKSEFVPLSAILSSSTQIEDVPEHMFASKLMLFTRDTRNIYTGNIGTRMLPSGHDIIQPNAGDYRLKFDITRKGNKQVIRRRYKVGYVWPRTYTEDGRPGWDGDYLSSNWTTIQAEYVVRLYSQRSNEFSIKVL